MKLALGTAQFGLPYGVANKRGQIPLAEAAAILALARNVGIDTIDTAIAYGDSEALLGKIGMSGLKVVTKLPPVPDQSPDVELWIRSQVLGSLQRLGIDKLYGLLLHQVNELKGHNGKIIAGTLNALKVEGLVEKIGVSIYAPDDSGMAIAAGVIDLVQAPFNLFDRRLYDSGWLHRLTEQGVELHTRSAFLQGLLLMPPSAVPAKFSQWADQLSSWHSWLAEHPHIKPAHACLAFIAGHPQIDRVVVGMDDLAQFKQLLVAEEFPVLEELPNFSNADEALINPSNWSSL
jgi:hypothetical protein